jgi:hypothetical protein
MSRFRTLLKPTPQSFPQDDQERAAKGLAGAVAASNLRWWQDRGLTPQEGRCLLLVVAPYSHYDLILLDLLDASLPSKTSPEAQVYVANLLDYDNPKQLEADVPGIGPVHQTPLAALWESGRLMRSAWGKEGRDLAAEVVGLPAEELNRRIMAESSQRFTAAPC